MTPIYPAQTSFGGGIINRIVHYISKLKLLQIKTFNRKLGIKLILITVCLASQPVMLDW